MEAAEEVPEERLQEGERRTTDHHHEGVAITNEALEEHLVSEHGIEVREGLSLATLRGMHDRFHGEAHAVED